MKPVKKTRKKPTHKKKVRGLGSDTVEGIASLAMALGVPVRDVEIISSRIGLPGKMLGGRYHVPTVKKWWEANKDLIERTLAYKSPIDEIKEQELRIKKAEADEVEGKSLNKEWVCGRLHKLLIEVRRIAYGKLEDELPAQMTLDVPSNRALLRVAADQMIGEIA